MPFSTFTIQPMTAKYQRAAEHFLQECWGDTTLYSGGHIRQVTNLPGIIALRGTTIEGLVTYLLTQQTCEIVTLNSRISNQGTGSSLLAQIIQKARTAKCKRIFLYTTNDNLRAPVLCKTWIFTEPDPLRQH